MAIRSYYSKEAASPSQPPTVTALPEGEPRAYAPPDAPCERPLPLPLGEVAERSEDGEGKQCHSILLLKRGRESLSVTYGDSSPRGRAEGLRPS